MCSVLTLFAIVAAGASFARADTIEVVNAGFTDTDADTNFEFNYTAALVNVPPSEIRSGDFFVIFDFEGYVAGSSFAPVNWSGAYTLTGFPTTLEPTFTNDPLIGDLVFTYSGSTITTAGALGLFGAETTEKFYHLDAFRGHDHNSSNNTEQNNYGTLFVPTSDTVGGTPVPLPAAAWAGMALFGLIGGVRLKKSAAV
jgi:hypothetical protein